MRKVLFALLALTFISQTYSPCKSKDETLVVLIVLENTKPSSSTNRSLAQCPIDGYYHTLTNMVELSFKSNLGNVFVTLDNMTAGETYEYSGSSAAGGDDDACVFQFLLHDEHYHGVGTCLHDLVPDR